jgi:hypothetical protein
VVQGAAVEASTMVNAPRQTVLDVSADGPRLFLTMSGVRLLGREGLG